jgi:hypothetical protein
MTAPKRAIDWLEQNYHQPQAFQESASRETHTPPGLLQVKPNHPSDCLCETGEGEFWTQSDAAMKWPGGDH